MATMTQPAIPDHVPQHLLYDFHLFGDVEYTADPYARAARVIREAPPIFWSPRGNCWYVTRYSSIVEVTKQIDTFSSVMRPNMPEDFFFRPVPQNMDPPKHAKYAAPLKAAFSPASAARLTQAIREIAIRCVEPVVQKGECEFIKEVAEPLPILMFLKIMGVPFERFGEFRQLALELLGAPSDEIMLRKAVDADAMMSEIIDDRRKRPGDDVVSQLWQTRIDERPINFVEMRHYGMMLFTAGLDSVTNGMGHSVHHLARHPELQQRLANNPKEIYATTEELLRRYGVTTPPRRVTRDTVFEGVEMRAEDKLELWLLAANLDPAAFPYPEEVIPQRSERTHLTFGYGIHRCIGAHLARVELHVLYEEWLKRIPRMELDPRYKVTYDPGHVLRITQLPLRWNA